MIDLYTILLEVFRALAPGGMAIFVEPGAKHQESEKTKEFIQKHKSHDYNWIESHLL